MGTCHISSRMSRPTSSRSYTSTRCSKHSRESKRIGAWEARPCTTSKPPSSVHQALVCAKRAGDTMSLSVQRLCCKDGKANLFCVAPDVGQLPNLHPTYGGSPVCLRQTKRYFRRPGIAQI